MRFMFYPLRAGGWQTREAAMGCVKAVFCTVIAILCARNAFALDGNSVLAAPGFWVPNTAILSDENLNMLSSAQIKRLHLQVTSGEAWIDCNTKAVVKRKNKNAGAAVAKLKNRGFSPALLLYVAPRRDYIDELTSEKGLLSDFKDSGVVAIEYDLEGEWSRAKPCGFPSHSEAFSYLKERTTKVMGSGVPVGLTTHFGRARDPHIPMSSADFVTIQAYSRCKGGCPTWSGPEGPGNKQERIPTLLENYKGVVVVGLAAYGQDWPKTVGESDPKTAALRKSYLAARELIRKDPVRYAGYMYWSTDFLGDKKFREFLASRNDR
uniref:hypothetical protein n=1 Tax=Cupriavidus yeoncheonensis TaxID=1462994 RepID=UPI003F496770